jgi:hypothetical protein
MRGQRSKRERKKEGESMEGNEIRETLNEHNK